MVLAEHIGDSLQRRLVLAPRLPVATEVLVRLADVDPVLRHALVVSPQRSTSQLERALVALQRRGKVALERRDARPNRLDPGMSGAGGVVDTSQRRLGMVEPVAGLPELASPQ